MARIQFVNQHYWPETASTGQHLTDLAEHLVSEGHEVRVLCGRPRASRGKRLPSLERHAGVDIRRVGGWSLGGSRMFGYATFHAAVGPRLLASSWADVVVTLTTPPLIGMWGSLSAKLHGCAHLAYIMDHHPDAEFESGMIQRDSLVGRSVEAIYRWTLKNATGSVVLGPYQGRRVMERGVDASTVATVPIWSSGDEVRATEEEAQALREELGWSGFTVLYSGNAGVVHRFEELLEAMATLDESDSKVRFAFVGGGPRRSEIERFVRERELRNTSFHPAQPRARLGALLSAADAHFVSLRPEQVGVSVPGKLYGQLASARPVLFVGPERCETADDVRDSGGGRTFAVGQREALAAELRSLASDPERCSEQGRAGRAWFLRHRERSVSCAAWSALIDRVLEQRGVGRAGAAHGGSSCASSP